MSKQLRIWLFALLGTLLTSTSILAEGVITMTTTKAVGETIRLNIGANGDVTIDGVKESAQTNGYNNYTLTSQTVTIRGDVTNLSCYRNQLTSLDVSGCTSLTTLDCWENQLTSLNASGCTSLTKLNCERNQLTSLDVSGCTSLTTLECYENQLTSLNASGCTSLTKLSCERNQLTSLDVSGCSALTSLSCYNNQLTSLDVSGCTALTTFRCYNNQLTSLDVSGCSALIELECYSNQLTSLDVSGCSALTTLDCRYNQLTSLDVSGCTSLTTLNCYSNLLRQLNVAGCANLSWLDCSRNQIKGSEMVNLVNSLPDRQGAEEGFFYVFKEKEYYSDVEDGNVCLAAHVATAKAKNWRTLFYRNDQWLDYAGLDNPTFVVTYSSSNGGRISISGADDLQNVPYDTELTVTETSVADGYKLTKLTANRQDILQTKRFKVTENTRVEATFTLQAQAYSVTTVTLGKGTLQVTGADDLNAVAPGTELTVTATPAEGYELTELTANGYSILRTKKIVVNEDLVIKAVFKEKTYRVSLDRAGEGTLYVTGADDLDAVTPGTELTVTAIPAEGYELTELTANDRNILDTKKVVVNEDMIIRAIFSQKTFKVSLTKRGNGTIRAIGADDLNAVPYGTKLTITATPAEGYELTGLLANGFDILSNKSVEVIGDTRIKAIFRKKTFAVTLTSNEHGTISIVEPVDLDVVAYGTTLTVKATGKNAQCELTALTANGEDILATQSFVVKGATEVKATFVDHTGVETTVTQQVKLYPNPATDYVIVEGVAPASEVTLHSMTGERLYADRADSRGTLRIDLTPYADGVYLVCVAGETYRVVVRR